MAIAVDHEMPTSAVAQRLRGQSPLEPYVSANVVADHLGIERRQVLALTRAGKLPAHAVDPTSIRKQWRYKLSEIDAAINVHRNSNDSGVATNAARPHNGARQPRHQKAR